MVVLILIAAMCLSLDEGGTNGARTHVKVPCRFVLSRTVFRPLHVLLCVLIKTNVCNWRWLSPILLYTNQLFSPADDWLCE